MMFDYKGLKEEELLDLCNEKNAKKTKAKVLYWTSEAYSFGTQYRKYAFFPKWLPLCIYSDHGIEFSRVAKHEIEQNAKAMFVFCKEKQENFKKVSDTPCYITKAPLILYRNLNKIKQAKNAKGTICYPSHSTPEIDLELDMQKYIDELKALPSDMQPVCVCLHMHDINKGGHKIFIQNNIPVYTAGHVFDTRYAKRFYDILKNFKYSCSNHTGSYAFYSVEMGIPFSLFGQECRYFNKNDTNLPKGEYKYQENKEYKKTKEIFFGINKKITEKQIKYVEKYANSKQAISRLKMAYVLWSAYFKRKFTAKKAGSL